MNVIRLYTTGNITGLTLHDMGELQLIHPVSGLCINEFLTDREILDSEDLKDAISNDYIYLLDEYYNPIDDITKFAQTLSGYGITDAYTKTEVNNNFLSANTSFYTQSDADAKFVYKTGDTMSGTLVVPLLTSTTVSATTLHGDLSWLYVTTTPTTIAGYGITDAYTTGQSNTNFLSANTSLSGLSDVDLTSPKNNQVLIYSSGTWLNNEPKKHDIYLTYDGTSGTTSGTYGCTLTSPGHWTITEFNSVYYTDDTYGNLVITLPDSNSENQGKSIFFVKPRSVTSNNNVTLITSSGQSIEQQTSFTYYNSGDHFEIISTQWSTLGSMTYKYRVVSSDKSFTNTIEVGLNQIHKTVKSAVDYFNKYAIDNTIIQIHPGNYYETDTITINNPEWGLTIEGKGSDISNIFVDNGMIGKPLFDLKSNCCIYNVGIYGDTLEKYGALSSETAVLVSNTGISLEIQNCYIHYFYNGIKTERFGESWIFNSDIDNCVIACDVREGLFQTSELGLYNNIISYDIYSGDTLNVSILNNDIYTDNSAYTFIRWNPNSNTAITCYNSIYVNACNLFGFNNQPYAISGFNWSTYRDANINIYGNNNLSDYLPYIYISQTSTTSTTVVSTTNYYTMNVTPFRIVNIKYIHSNNVTTFLPDFSVRNNILNVVGSLAYTSTSCYVYVAVFGRSNSADTFTHLTEVPIRIITANIYYQFSVLYNFTQFLSGNEFVFTVKGTKTGTVSIKDLKITVT